MKAKKHPFKVGSSFFLDADKSHLRVLISDPNADPDNIVIVNVTTWDENKDQSCILEPGDHPSVAHKSCVNYRQAFLAKLTEISQGQSAGKINVKQDMPHAVLEKIWQGAAKTDQIPRGCKKILKDQGLNIE